MNDDGLLNLAAYLDRIGYDGPRDATLPTLAAIVRAHVEAVPFENLDPFLGWEVPLDVGSLQTKLVTGGRGGYCFEQNTVLQAALLALGFRTTGLAARVVWNGPPDAVTPRTHMVLLVDIEGQPYLADVGFGGQTPTGPLAFRLDEAQATPHGRYRLVAAADSYTSLETEVAGEWRPMYRFDLVEQHPVDYLVLNHYVATHPASHFVTSLSAARATADGRWALADRQLTFYGLDGTVKRRQLENADELLDVLGNDLLVHVDDDRAAEVRTAFVRLG